jgi:hypothetical protein
MSTNEKSLNELEEVQDNTARAERDRLQRAAILEGAKDPANFQMPDGRTLQETREAIDKLQNEEGQKLADSTRAATRVEGMQNEPMKDEVKIVTSESGALLIHPLATDADTAPPAGENQTPEDREERKAPPFTPPQKKQGGGTGGSGETITDEQSDNTPPIT